MARVLSPETETAIEALCSRYPSRLAALLPALHLAQKQHGYISAPVEEDVSELLRIPLTRVREVVSFYSMFYDRPVGRHVVKICRNLPCALRGADKLTSEAENILGIKVGETTADGRITLEHDECLASCGTGPMLWCNDTLLENVDTQKLSTFLAELN